MSPSAIGLGITGTVGFNLANIDKKQYNVNQSNHIACVWGIA